MPCTVPIPWMGAELTPSARVTDWSEFSHLVMVVKSLMVLTILWDAPESTNILCIFLSSM